MRPLSAIPARLAFACGHVALVSLPRLRGESPRQRIERVRREKVAAAGRACDFCAPRAHDLATTEALRALAGPPDPVSVDDPTLVVAADPGRAPERPTDGHSIQDHEEVPMDPTAAAAVSPTDQAAAEPAGQPAPRAKGVFPPPRKLTDEQEQQVKRLYAETDTPIGEIAQRFGIAPTSVQRVAVRQGAALRGTRQTGGGAPQRGPAAAAEPPAAGSAGGGRTRRGNAPATRPATRPRAGAAGAGTPTRATAAAPGASAALPGSGKAQRGFRVVFVAEQVVEAEDIRDVLRQVEALGATDITSIARED